ncbi:HET-domain-containing protein [Cucurbitaria berberidis CBS 394.84]|uniref:HET-domain-containing protein n=1 Tax=Cucurbitaria berberidis CBS 394.84 TaxID=1168544 RepID=A0A9P4GF47_9PLEO|nr:HET-domain-containing protein [Cucurbitaria berberidis CBS 394.84]KAF1844893.1 HET-domain-containing protein [Cucurbitaria berberidis CBS 394.84]
MSKPVNTSQEEFRLITIDSCSTSNFMSCTLETTSLRDMTQAYRKFVQQRSSAVPSLTAVLADWLGTGNVGIFPDSTHHRFQWGDYCALSYVWGNTKDTTNIFVNGVETQVTKNLAEALHRLRETGQFSGRFRLWADALCINQKNNVERSAQVGAMRIFYSQAWSVIGFLGPQEDESDKALDLIGALSDIYHSNEKCEELRENMMQEKYSHVPGSWLALKRLTLRPYWERLWIMQELALGGARTVLICGSKRVSWQTFCRGLGVIQFYLWVPRHKAIDYDRQAEPSSRDNGNWYDTRTLDHIWKDLWQLTQVQESNSHAANLTRLMEMANSCNCSDARDKVYGLLGIMDPLLARAIIPDYTSDVATVFIRTADAYISTYRNLELLRDANLWGRVDTPSWVPDWTWSGRSRDSRPDDFFQPDFAQRENGDGTMEARSYCADRGLPFALPRRTGRYLVSQAVKLDTVDGLGYTPEAENPAMIQSQILSSSAYGDSNTISTQLSIALYAGRRRRKEDSQALLNFPLTLEDAEKQFRTLRWKRFVYDLDYYYSRWTTWFSSNADLLVGGRHLRTYFSGKIPDDADVYDYWSAYQGWVRTALAGPRRLVTTTAGRIGWVECARGVQVNEELEVRRGDVFAVFPGCSTPILLRPSKESDVFQVIGEAYLQGVMEGEVEELVRSKQCELQWVRLC